MRSSSSGPISKPALAVLRAHAERYVQPTSADYEHLLRLGQEHDLPPKTYLARAGEVCDQVHFVLEGVARHYCVRAGQEHTVGFALPGQLLTDSSSFFTRQPSQRHLVAITRLRTISLGYEQVQALYRHCPVWAECGRLLTEAYTVYLTERALAMQLQSAAARYEGLMRTHPELFNQLPLNQLASYLGIAKETLSRLRRRPSARS